MINYMPTLLQINVTANSGSTGRIAEQINQMAQKHGWKTYLAYGRNMQSCKSELVHVGNKLQVYEHYAEHRLFDNDGLASRIATRCLVKKIEEIKPDIIHLHNIHDHWINYRILFEYLNTLNIPIVWTQHDCWSFTGGCAHFSQLACNKWIVGCSKNCPCRNGWAMRKFLNQVEKHYNLKKDLFTATKNLTLVPVSHWLEGVLSESFLKSKPIKTILNGIDMNLFKPIDNLQNSLRKFGLEGVRYVVGVATAWSERKGFKDYCRLASQLPDGVKIVLVGLTEKQNQEAAKYGIIGIPRTEKVSELVALYEGASIVMNLSYEETFGLTTVEGFACGTPSIVYNATASPELVLDSPKKIEHINLGEPLYVGETGWIVEQGDVAAVAKVISDWVIAIANDSEEEVKMRKKCRERAKRKFNKEDRFAEYLKLYNDLLAKK